MTTSGPTDEFDLITIGAGSGGVRASRVAAQRGARVAIIEERDLGGTCVNVGCVPKKLMSYAAHCHEEFDDAAGFGWTVPEPAFDWKTLIARKNAEIERLNGIYGKLLAGAGVELILGRAFEHLLPEEGVIFLRDEEGEYYRAAMRSNRGGDHDYLYSETLFTTLLLASLWLLHRHPEGAGRRDCVLAGVLFGLAALTRSAALYFLPLWLAWLIWLEHRGDPASAGRRAAVSWRRALVVTSVALATVLPWTLRNAVSYRDFLLIGAGVTASPSEKVQLFLDYERMEGRRFLDSWTLTGGVVANF